MKKKIAILGSTGSIGKNTLRVIRKDKKNFEVTLISTNKNFKSLIKQAKEFNVKNIIVNDPKSYEISKNKLKNSKINIFNSFNHFHNIFKKKNDLIMCSISGLDGLESTIKSIKHTKKILIANKESIICGWDIINKELKKYKTEFIPVDSEHFSIFSMISEIKDLSSIRKIYLTASGGPFLNLSKKDFGNINLKNALRHPNWKMGKKITIDSATLMNKVFEVIEAKKIFNLDYKDINILTHPKSYIHAIIKLKSGLIEFLAHEPDMIIPIHNAIYYPAKKHLFSKSLDLKKMNDLNFSYLDQKKFFLTKILKNMPENSSLFETALITINDFFVEKFLNKEINFLQMMKLIAKIVNLREFQNFKKKTPDCLDDIIYCKNYVSLKLKNLHV